MNAEHHLGSVQIRVIKISTKIPLSYRFVHVDHQKLTLFTADIIFAYDTPLL